MTLPKIQELCDDLDLALDFLCIQLPGGGKLCAIGSLPQLDLMSIAKSALGTVNAALTPLLPIFTIIETVNAIFNCILAVKETLTSFPPDPLAIIECLPALQEKIRKLLQLIPILSIPQMLKDLIGVLIAFLAGVRNELIGIRSLIVKIVQSAELAKKFKGLLLALDCANASKDAAISNLARAIGSIMIIVDLINNFGELIGQDEIISFTFTDLGDSIEPAIEAVQYMIVELVKIQEAIPAPTNNIQDYIRGGLITGDREF
jgi:hypothetical protein